MAIRFIELMENYTSYGFSPTGKMWKSSSAVGGQGVEFKITGQKYQTPGTRFCLNFWDANCVGRDTTGGEVFQKPSASFGAQATCISAEPFPEPAVMTISLGDVLICPALDLVIKVVDGGRWADPIAEIVSCQPATEDYAELVAEKNAIKIDPKYLSEAYLSQ